MLKINLSKRTSKFLKQLPVKQAKQIVQKIMLLREDPIPNDYKKLKGSNYFRVDSGEYRIVYSVEGDTLNIILAGKRNDEEVYRKLKRL